MNDLADILERALKGHKLRINLTITVNPGDLKEFVDCFDDALDQLRAYGAATITDAILED